MILAGLSTVLTASAAAAPRAPSPAQVRALRRAEAHRHHPRGTRILALRVDGADAAVIWRAPHVFGRATRGSKIINVGRSTDYYSHGPAYKPSKPSKRLRPRFYDVHAAANGHGRASSAAPEQDGGIFGTSCLTGSDAITSTSTETFSVDATHVGLPGGQKIKSIHARYEQTLDSTEKIGPCGSDPGRTDHCNLILGLGPGGASDGQSIQIDGNRVDVGPTSFSDISRDCPNDVSATAQTLTVFIGGAASLPADALANGYGINTSLELGPTVKRSITPKSCNAVGCGQPPDCAVTSGASGPSSTCQSTYTWSGRIEAFPAAF